VRLRLALFAALLVAASSCRTAVPPAPTSDSATQRTLTSGRVIGSIGAHGTHVWRGIPHAAPPTGALRWRAPEPAAPWQGVREALASGARCPQLASRLDSSLEPGTPIGDEDCLTADVWAPPGASGLPVMVWIHGGGNVSGGSDFYDGAALAARGNVVVVSVQYRLGPLGWLRHASLREGVSSAEESGNFGVLDLIHALHWVRENAAAFGGDPESVTIFGESAGARNVLMLMLAPAAHGLFHGAVVQSGGARTSGLDEAEDTVDAQTPGDPQSSGELLLRLRIADGAADREAARAELAVMVDEEIARYLRAKSAAEIIACYQEDGEGTGLYRMPQMFRDGVVLPEAEPLEAFSTGDYARVPVILGSNRDEAKLFMFASPDHVRRFLGIPRLRDARAYESEADYRSRFWKATGVDELAAAMRRAQGPAVFAYRFDWDEQPSVLGADLGRMLGAAHFLEVPFVFAHWDVGPSSGLVFDEDNAPGREALSDAMLSYWAEFAWTGAPGRGRGGALPPWPAWDPSRVEADKYHVLDTEQDGGIRTAWQVESGEALLAELGRDAAWDRAGRCALFADFARSAPRLSAHGAALGCAVETIASGD